MLYCTKEGENIMQKKQKGFTLIELLIVVVVLGVLVGVALPQYQKAVMRSRFAEVEVIMRSIMPAVEEYCLANASSREPIDINSLSISYPITSIEGMSFVKSSSGTSLATIDANCITFLQGGVGNVGVIGYIFDKDISHVLTSGEIERSLIAMVGYSTDGRRICEPVPTNMQACANLGFTIQNLTYTECNSRGYDCHEVERAFWAD